MINLNREVFETIRGTYNPSQMFTFVSSYNPNDRGESLNGEDAKVLFHEKFHHWQTIMTGYGHLKWGANRSLSTDILEIWVNYSKETQGKAKIPIGYIIEDETKAAMTTTASIYTQKMSMGLFNLKERVFSNAEMIKYNLLDEEIVAPTINVIGEQRILNGIDIIECFAKYQEAIFGYIAYGIPFEETMNLENLYEEYYIPFIYFIEQVDKKRALEFPLICDLALQLKNIGFPKKNNKWEDNHPAWRFLKIVEALKNNTDIPYLDYSNIEETSKTYIDKILNVCNFETLDNMWQNHLEYINQVDLLMCEEMKKAVYFKLEYPWALAYPFYNYDIMTKINNFHPTAYKFLDTTTYPVSELDDSLWIAEIIFEYHLQAFAKQICGEISSYCIYRDEIQCGFTYYGLKGCEHYDKGCCSGSLNVNDGLQVKCRIDIEKNIADGCTFELFLKMSNIDIKDIEIQDKIYNINLDYISEKRKSLGL